MRERPDRDLDRAGAPNRHLDGGEPGSQRVTITNVLIAVNVITYVWLTTTGGLSSDRALYDHGALLGVACTEGGQWWRIVSGAFLHGGLVHIAFNMFALFQVGSIVELLFGKLRYAALYAVALAGSGLAVVYVAPNDLTVGASGAIFGLFGALVAVGLRLGPRGRGLIGQVLPVIVINLVLTFTIPNISAAGHIGGLITGFLAGLILFMVPSRQRDYAYAYAAGPDEAPPVDTIEQPRG
jgi:membrane associated rhomboid family serine protease